MFKSFVFFGLRFRIEIVFEFCFCGVSDREGVGGREREWWDGLIYECGCRFWCEMIILWFI